MSVATQQPIVKKKMIVKKLPYELVISEEPLLIIQTEEPSKKKIQTEDLGKQFEMAICLLYGIPFVGKYNYSMEKPKKIKDRLYLFAAEFPHKLKHTAENGGQYDFTGIEDSSIKLSAKTTKKDNKVCPQVIGQPTKKSFCAFFGIDLSYSLEQIKSYIVENVVSMLDIYFGFTFDCPVLFYNEKNDTVQLIKLVKKIDWSEKSIEFSHIKNHKDWNESSSISVDGVTIGEFQIHNHRNNIKFRWAFVKLLTKFPESFEIVNL